VTKYLLKSVVFRPDSVVLSETTKSEAVSLVIDHQDAGFHEQSTRLASSTQQNR
jgi:hypothetical protein